MASSNPFRKSSGPATSPTGPSVSAAARFPPLDALDTSPAPEPSAGDKKNKVIKKVRVLSPPPLSPDSPDWPYTPPPLAAGLHQSRENDPFDLESPDDSDREIMPSATPPPPKEGSRLPTNPFSKTLRDMETSTTDQKMAKDGREGEALKASSRRSLDVNSFKRLLMTGNLGADAPTQRSTAPRTGTDSSLSVSSSSYDGSKDGLATARRAQEVSLISQDMSDTPDDDEGSLSDSSASFQIGRGKKPPPPPSSRHGKSIKLELKSNDAADILTVKSPSDINKPLPPAPRMSLEKDGEPLRDDGKVADLQPQQTPGSGKKAGPAPPPRRGHSRGESKAYTNSIKDGLQVGTHDEALSRSSSIRSTTNHKRSDSRGPLPPPPPRRSHGSRQSTIISPETVAAIGATTVQPSASPESLSEADRSPRTDLAHSRNMPTGGLKPTAPPPPPTRNASVRRPASVRSVDSSSRRTSADTKPHHNGMAPPPPPRRNRGTSQGSMDGPHRRTSVDEAATMEHGNASTTMAHKDRGSQPQEGVDILADLTALQREVDALRGKFGP